MQNKQNTILIADTQLKLLSRFIADLRTISDSNLVTVSSVEEAYQRLSTTLPEYFLFDFHAVDSSGSGAALLRELRYHGYNGRVCMLSSSIDSD